MNSDVAIQQAENTDVHRTAGQIGFFMAVLSTALGVLYLIGLVGKIIVDGTVHSVSSPGIQIVSAVTAILLDLALLIMFVALRYLLSGRNVVFADLAVVFMTLVCVTSSINWFVQLAVLPRVAGSSDATLLALTDVHNSSSVMYAIEHLGWGIFYGLATIFLAVSFGKSERSIR